MHRSFNIGLDAQIKARVGVLEKYDCANLKTSNHMKKFLSSIQAALSTLPRRSLSENATLLIDQLSDHKCQNLEVDIETIYKYADSKHPTKSNLLHYLAFHNKAIEFKRLENNLPADQLVELCVAKEENGLTPLMVAVANNCQEFVISMAKSKVFKRFANVQSREKFSALMTSLLIINLDIALILLRHQVDATLLSVGSTSAFMLLCRLQSKGNEDKLLEIFEVLAKDKRNITVHKNVTSIAYCIQAGNIFMLKTVLGKFPNLVNQSRYSDKKTPLMEAFSCDDIDSDLRLEISNFLMNAPRIDFTAIAQNGRSILEYLINNCPDDEPMAEMAAVLATKGVPFVEGVKLAVKLGKLRILNSLLKTLTDYIPEGIYQTVFEKLLHKHGYRPAHIRKKEFELLDTLINKDRKCAHWRFTNILSKLQDLYSNPTILPYQIALDCSIKHIYKNKKDVDTKLQVHNLISMASLLKNSVYLRNLIKYQLEDIESTVSFEEYSISGNASIINKRKIEEANSNYGQCKLCYGYGVDPIYPKEPRMYVSPVTRSNCCITCAYLNRNTVTNGEYMKYKNKIASYNMARFVKNTEAKEIIPAHIEYASNAKLEGALYNKLNQKQKHLIGLE